MSLHRKPTGFYHWPVKGRPYALQNSQRCTQEWLTYCTWPARNRKIHCLSSLKDCLTPGSAFCNKHLLLPLPRGQELACCILGAERRFHSKIPVWGEFDSTVETCPCMTSISRTTIWRNVCYFAESFFFPKHPQSHV